MMALLLIGTHLLPIVLALVFTFIPGGVFTAGIGYHMDAIPD
jgi:hypothetical protein